MKYYKAFNKDLKVKYTNENKSNNVRLKQFYIMCLKSRQEREICN